MSRGLKKVSVVIAVLVFILVVTFIVIKSKKIDEVEVSRIDLQTVKDGNYTGEYAADLVKVKVTVSVVDNAIKEVNIDEHQNGLGKKAEVIIDKIIEEQSLQVDSVSGATASSNAIKKAIEDGLKKGIQE